MTNVDMTSSDSIESDQSKQQDQHGGGFYFRSVRWVLLLSLVMMSVMCLAIFTEDAQIKEFSQEATFVSLSSLALVGLGIYGAYKVRIYYVMAFSVLLLILMMYKFTSTSFQLAMLHSMFMHLPHFIALLCGFAFSCLAISCC